MLLRRTRPDNLHTIWTQGTSVRLAVRPIAPRFGHFQPGIKGAAPASSASNLSLRGTCRITPRPAVSRSVPQFSRASVRSCGICHDGRRGRLFRAEFGSSSSWAASTTQPRKRANVMYTLLADAKPSGAACRGSYECRGGNCDAPRGEAQGVCSNGWYGNTN